MRREASRRIFFVWPLWSGDVIILVNRLRASVGRLSRTDGFYLLLVLALSSGAWIPLLHPGFLNTRAGGDSPFLLVRLDQLLRNLRAGVFPVRWMPDAAYGLGYPFFNYYAALPYYLAAGLVLWGWGPIAALKITQAIGFLASGAAMYALGCRVFRRRVSAVLATAAFVYAPFHLVNVYVRGDSLSEFYAFVWMPLLGWALIRLRDRVSIANILLLGGSYCGLVLTHNISALTTTPVVLIAALFLLLAQQDRTSGLRFVLGCVAAGLLGLGLSSWFWVPAFLERDLVQLESMTTGYFHFSRHFRGLDLVQSSWSFDYIMGDGGNPFSMGRVQAALAVLGGASLVGAAVRRRVARQSALLGAFALAMGIVITLGITPLSRPLWEHVPLLPLVQFPWRLLSIQALFTGLLTGALVERVPHGQLVAAFAVVLLTVSGLAGLRPDWLAISDGDITPDSLRWYEYFTTNIGTTVRAEYLPQEVATRPYTSAEFLNRGLEPLPMVIEGVTDGLSLIEKGPIREVWDISVSSEQADLAFHTYYFPGWRATVDGKPYPVSAVDDWGTLGLTVPQGLHRVVLRLGRTPLRWIAELASLLTALAALGLMGRMVHRGEAALPSLSRSLFVLGVLLIAAIALRLIGSRTSSLGDVTMDLVRRPYAHHNPGGVCFEDVACLVRYTRSADTVRAGEQLTVTLDWSLRGDQQLTDVFRLTSPSRPIFQDSAPAVEVTDRKEIVSDPSGVGRSVHSLTIPAAAVPGPYLLSVELRGEGDLVEPVTAQGGQFGTTYLLPVWVKEGPRTAWPGEALAVFGQRIELLAVEAARPRDERVDVVLTWRAIRPIPANYNLSLRLKDPSGRQVSVRDVQPHYGYYPTSVWPPGTPVQDRLSLEVPDDMASGPGYALELILYRVASLEPVGQAEVGIEIPG